MANILQANLNYARRAQDLFLHTMAELNCGLGIASEPYGIPRDHPRWAGDRLGSVAITWREAKDSDQYSTLETGEGYVVVRWGQVVVVRTYIPHQKSRGFSMDRFESRLDQLRTCIRKYSTEPILIAGDFNASSALWGSRWPNQRGETVKDWAAELGLVLLNEGNSSTCVAPRGESIVDLTWATPAAARLVKRWKVEEEVETLSDHLYIVIGINVIPPGVKERRKQASKKFKKWSLLKMDADKFRAAILAAE